MVVDSVERVVAGVADSGAVAQHRTAASGLATQIAPENASEPRSPVATLLERLISDIAGMLRAAGYDRSGATLSKHPFASAHSRPARNPNASVSIGAVAIRPICAEHLECEAHLRTADAMNSTTRHRSNGELSLQPGVYFLRAQERDSIVLRMVFVPHCKIVVDLWWNNFGANPDVRLYVQLNRSSVEFGALTGNGFDSPLHQQGFGTLAVNTAIQVLQDTYPSTFAVEGVLQYLNEDALDDLQRHELARLRRTFWNNFGMNTLPASDDSQFEYLSGSVGKLKLQENGTIHDQFSRFVPLSQFVAQGLHMPHPKVQS